MVAKDRYAVAVNGSSISMERPSDTVIRTEEGTTVCIVLLTFLSGFLENRAARSTLAFFCSKIHRVSVHIVDAL